MRVLISVACVLLLEGCTAIPVFPWAKLQLEIHILESRVYGGGFGEKEDVRKTEIEREIEEELIFAKGLER